MAFNRQHYRRIRGYGIRYQPPKPLVQPGRWWLFAVCLLLGLGLPVMLQTPALNGTTWSSLEQVNQLLNEQSVLEQQHLALSAEMDILETHLEAYRTVATRADPTSALREELAQAQQFAGRSAMQGPGVEIVLNDRKLNSQLPMLGTASWALVHDVDLLRVVNELTAGGAEAISINGQRYVSQTRIRCGGPTIHVKDQPLVPPYVISAIGDADQIIHLFMTPPGNQLGLYQELSSYGIEITIRKVDSITVPRFMGYQPFAKAQPMMAAGSE